MSTMGILWTAVACTAACLGLLVAGFFLIPLFLAQISVWRYNKRRSNNDDDEKQQWTNLHSALYAGKVWHTRHSPVKHAFQYPLFLFCLDLKEVEDDSLFQDKLWPLSTIVSFRPQDHLKNGEGMLTTDSSNDKEAAADSTDDNNNSSSNNNNNNSLQARICRLVATRTKSKFQPTPQTHRIVLVTHLCYYGYCFNPVSFYYILQDSDTASNKGKCCKTVAVVAEVSNTPWLEMHCYVLHPDSIDNIKSVVSTNNTGDSINYVFDKTFHVSPFMEMNYLYDWTFGALDTRSTTTTTNNNVEAETKQQVPLRITTAMKKKNDDDNNTTTLQFSATMHVHRKSMHPVTIAWQVATYPVYCALIQVWIHVEAFKLFGKGVAFQPHPNAAETTASAVIGAVMVPLFALKDWMNGRGSSEDDDQAKKNC